MEEIYQKKSLHRKNVLKFFRKAFIKNSSKWLLPILSDIFESQRIKRFETSRRSSVIKTLKLEMPEDTLHHLTEVAIN